LPSLLAVVATFAMHWWLQRDALRDPIASSIALPPLSRAGATTGYGIACVAVALLLASALGVPLGVPTFAVTSAVALVVLAGKRESPWATLRGVSWSVLLLVAGLFVLVQGLQRTGVVPALAASLQSSGAASVDGTAWIAGGLVAIACNLLNNLPMGLIAGSALNATLIDPAIQGAIAIAVDLGPNLSVTGSLATILWLTALRREGIEVSAWQFLKLGMLVMPVALVVALASLLLAS